MGSHGKGDVGQFANGKGGRGRHGGPNSVNQGKACLLEGVSSNQGKTQTKKGFVPILQVRTGSRPKDSQNLDESTGFAKSPIRNPKEQRPKVGQAETIDYFPVPGRLSFPNRMSHGIKAQFPQAGKFTPNEGFGRPGKSGVKESYLTRHWRFAAKKLLVQPINFRNRI
jgi:hypothetical protein